MVPLFAPLVNVELFFLLGTTLSLGFLQSQMCLIHFLARICEHNLLVDMKHHRLIDACMLDSISLQSAPGPPPFLHLGVVSSGEFTSIISELPQITQPKLFGGFSYPWHVASYTHMCSPVHAQVCHMPPDKLAAAKAEFSLLESLGIVRHSSSSWSSPLHMVPKGSSWRPCSDYWRLNDLTKPDRYPVPHIQDCAARLAGVTISPK